MAKKATLRIVLERLQSLIQFIDTESDLEIHPAGCWCHSLCGACKVWQYAWSGLFEPTVCVMPKGHDGYHRGYTPSGAGCSWKDLSVPNATINYRTVNAKEPTR